MLHRIAPVAFAAFLLSAVSASAQIYVSSLAIGAGSFSARTDAFHSRSLHPDIEIGGRFLSPRMQWGLSWSRWNDQTLTPSPATDRLSWDAHRSHVFGARFAFRQIGTTLDFGARLDLRLARPPPVRNRTGFFRSVRPSPPAVRLFPPGMGIARYVYERTFSAARGLRLSVVACNQGGIGNETTRYSVHACYGW